MRRRAWMFVVAMLFGLTGAENTGAATPEGLAVERKPEATSGALVWRFSTVELADAKALAIVMPTLPDGAKVSEIRFAGRDTCAARPGPGGVATIPEPCSNIRALAGSLTVLLVTDGADRQGSIELEKVDPSAAKVEIACGPPDSPEACKDSHPTAAWRLARELGEEFWSADCTMLLNQWTRCPTDGAATRAWRRLTAAEPGAVWIRSRPAASEPLRQYTASLYAPPTTDKTLPERTRWCEDAWRNTAAPDARQLVCIDQRDVTLPGHVSIVRVVPPPPSDSARGTGGAPEPGDRAPQILPTGGLLVANEPVTIYVRMPPDVGASVEVDGNLGFEMEGILDRAGVAAAGTSTPTPDRIVGQSFPSFSSGAMKVKVTFTREATPASKAYPHTYPLYVDRRIWGAFRAGLAVGYTAPRDGVPYDRYSVAPEAGSASAQIMDDGGDQWLDSELTFGLTLFLGHLSRGAPLYESKLGQPHGALYLGVGVLNLSASSLEDALPAVHIGPELSIGRNTGIALVFSMRPKRALGLGLAPGDYAESDSTLPSRVVPTFGGSIVLNLTPDALNLAMGKPR